MKFGVNNIYFAGKGVWAEDEVDWTDHQRQSASVSDNRHPYIYQLHILIGDKI